MADIARNVMDWVYPRTGGGTAQDAITMDLVGVYPRTGGGTGSASRHPGIAARVYPRTGGGTLRRWRILAPNVGVYPRTGGGTFAWAGLHRNSCGSIPARAGEPATSSPGSWAWEGLSPHGRGNPRAKTAAFAPSGSIPARAGEPERPGRERLGVMGLSPHGRGNLVAPVAISGRGVRGLSPHGRGNRADCTHPPVGWGLSPHGRGNRDGQPVQLTSSWVYPRTGGGTRLAHRVALETGSIPARAGEPSNSDDRK